MKYAIVILDFVFLGTMPSVVPAQSAGIEWEVLSQEVEELCRACKYDRAVQLAQKAP